MLLLLLLALVAAALSAGVEEAGRSAIELAP